jgi:hypothetical protein
VAAPTEDGIELFVVGVVDVNGQELLLHVVQVLPGFLEEDLVELAEVDARIQMRGFVGHVAHDVVLVLVLSFESLARRLAWGPVRRAGLG